MILGKLLKTAEEVTRKVLESITQNEPLLLTYLNQHSYNIYCKNKDYKELLDKKFEIYQADVGVFLALKFLFNMKVSRIDATEMNQAILNELIKLRIPLTIVGSKFDSKFIQEQSTLRGINLFHYQNGYFEEDQIQNIISKLSSVNNRIFIVGMGVPRQEFFAGQLSRSQSPRIIICVGNFLEFYFGTQRRAPLSLRKIGFEWVFRLFTEPRRLWKRYLIGIPEFMVRILKLKFNI